MAIQEKIIAELKRLSEGEQILVLNYARTIATRNRAGIPGKDLLPLAGTISEEDADLMMKAIEEDCGRVDPRDW
jgi:hypothetical protein